MNYYAMTDQAIIKEIGQRFRRLRLRKNITQEELARQTLLSLSVIKALESGKGKLSSMIAVLRELGALDDLDSFLPEPGISPMQLAKMKGKERHRASGSTKSSSDAGEDSEW
jgi:transcriptional regulator with XRE-family HTH domain